jgi:putative DNA primase/helicase
MTKPVKRQKPRRKAASRPKSSRKITRRKRATTSPPSTPTIARPREHLTDLGNAQRFVRVYGKSARHVPGLGWLIWTGQRWKRDELGEVMRFAKRTVERISSEVRTASNRKLAKSLRQFALRCETPARMNAMLELARFEPGISVMSNALDADPWKLNCSNGTVDLRTGQLHPHRLEDLNTKMVEVGFDPKAECPLFLKFLHRIFSDDAELIGFVQRVFGYALTGDTSAQSFFVFYGRGANGKSVLLDIILHIAGPYGKTMPPELLLKKPNGGTPFESADLHGCRVSVCSEVEQGRAFNEPLLKQLTGGDRMKARHLYQDFFEFTPMAKLILSANSLPEITGADHGIWRRANIIPFDVEIPVQEQDKQLAQKLKAEAPGILAWAVQGELERQKKGLMPPARVLHATTEYRDRMDTVGRFIADVCERAPGARVAASALHCAYVEWSSRNGEQPMTMKAFAARLEEHGITALKSGTMMRLGIRLR